MRSDLTPQQLWSAFQRYKDRPQTYGQTLDTDELVQLKYYLDQLIQVEWERAARRVDLVPYDECTGNEFDTFINQSSNYREYKRVIQCIETEFSSRANNRVKKITEHDISEVFAIQAERDKAQKELIIQQLESFSTAFEKINYLRIQKIEYLQNRTPETWASSGQVLLAGLSGEVFLDGWIELEIQKIKIESLGVVKKREFTLPEVALYFYYTGNRIFDPRGSNKEANTIAEAYGYVAKNSGFKLFMEYTKFVHISNRRYADSAKQKGNMLRRMKNIEPYLSECSNFNEDKKHLENIRF